MTGYSDRINHAFAYSAKHHDQQVRKGTRLPYLTHPANVAVILTRYGCNEETVVAGILHDVVEDCVREMSEAGFTAVSAQTFTATTRVDSAEQYLDLMARSGAPLVLLKKKLGDAWAATEQRLLAAIRRQIPDGGIDLAAEAILTVGTA